MKSGTLEKALLHAVEQSGWSVVRSWNDDVRQASFITLGLTYERLGDAVAARNLHIPSPASSLRRPPKLRGATGFPFKRR